MNQEKSQQLCKKANQLSQKTILQFFKEDSNRSSDFSVTACNLWLNYSRNHLDKETKQLLLDLAKVSGLSDKIKRLYNGEKINQSESRSVLHPLLRAPLDKSKPESILVHQELKKMQDFSDNLLQGNLFEQSITDVVCIGIGGSELGVKVVYQALMDCLLPKVRLHFIANIDGVAFQSTIRKISLRRSIFLITSKTFTTFETIKNFSALVSWADEQGLQTELMKRSFAITANPKEALKKGFDQNHIFLFWEWVGGRFSLWSAVGLPIILAYGIDVFYELLDGAWQMDQHFIEADFSENMPVLLGMIHIWYTNFLNYPSRAVIPYAERLDRFPSYLQQLEMESLGKSVDVLGNDLEYNTSPIIWGSSGSNGQHAFFQLLHQGNQVVPVDFIAAAHPNHHLVDHHNALLANCLAQSKSLMLGGEIGRKEHGRFLGNRPSNLIIMDRISPSCLGQLLALYEHKVFVQSVIWNINAFDQWGVELGKSIANDILQKIDSNKAISFEKIQENFSEL